MMQMKSILRMTTVVVLTFLGVALNASQETRESRCVIRGEADRKVYVYCPAELNQTDLLKEVLVIRDAKTTGEMKDIGIFVFSSENGPRSQQDVTKLTERSLQKIQTAVYMNYPNGETDYFCKRDGKMQKCKELLRTR